MSFPASFVSCVTLRLTAGKTLTFKLFSRHDAQDHYCSLSESTDTNEQALSSDPRGCPNRDLLYNICCPTPWEITAVLRRDFCVCLTQACRSLRMRWFLHHSHGTKDEMFDVFWQYFYNLIICLQFIICVKFWRSLGNEMCLTPNAMSTMPAVQRVGMIDTTRSIVLMCFGFG